MVLILLVWVSVDPSDTAFCLLCSAYVLMLFSETFHNCSTVRFEVKGDVLIEKYYLMDARFVKHVFLKGMIFFGVCLVLVGCLEKFPSAEQQAPPPSASPPRPQNQEIRVKDPDLDGYAFDRLNPTGKKIFLAAREYLKIQKTPQYHNYAQPLQCAVNVAYVLERSGIKLPYNATFAVPNLLQYIKSSGGEVHVLPLSHGQDRQSLLDYLNTHFSKGLPAGAVVAGCTVAHCDTSNYAEAHVSLLGDSNHRGELMLYHNNWLRPNSTKGVRKPYMVSVSHFYDLERPREWMATPWIRLERNEQGRIKQLHSIMPDLDDLDPLGGKYYISIGLLPSLLSDIEEQRELKHHRLIIEDNPHKNTVKDHPDHHRILCRSPVKGLKVMDARRGSPQGPLYTEMYAALRPYRSALIPYNSTFEFISLKKSQGWHSIKFYAVDRYFGEREGAQSVWVEDRHVHCKSQREWLNL